MVVTRCRRATGGRRCRSRAMRALFLTGARSRPVVCARCPGATGAGVSTRAPLRLRTARRAVGTRVAAVLGDLTRCRARGGGRGVRRRRRDPERARGTGREARLQDAGDRRDGEREHRDAGEAECPSGDVLPEAPCSSLASTHRDHPERELSPALRRARSEPHSRSELGRGISVVHRSMVARRREVHHCPLVVVPV